MAENADQDRQNAMRDRGYGDLEQRLWAIIDRDGLGDVPSDIVGAVARLAAIAAQVEWDQAEFARLAGAVKIAPDALAATEAGGVRGMEESMIERVARAIYIANHDGNPVGSEDGWELWLPDARAAIAALREPNEAMIVAAREWSRVKYGRPVGSDGTTGCWQCQIDAALAESGAEP